MSTEKTFTFRTLTNTFNTSFTKIAGSATDNSKLDGCKTTIDKAGRIVCGRQISPIPTEDILSLFGKK